MWGGAPLSSLSHTINSGAIEILLLFELFFLSFVPSLVCLCVCVCVCVCEREREREREREKASVCRV
jgi:hypothetical protein